MNPTFTFFKLNLIFSLFTMVDKILLYVNNNFILYAHIRFNSVMQVNFDRLISNVIIVKYWRFNQITHKNFKERKISLVRRNKIIFFIKALVI